MIQLYRVIMHRRVCGSYHCTYAPSHLVAFRFSSAHYSQEYQEQPPSGAIETSM